MLSLTLIILYTILSIFLLLRLSKNLQQHISARQVTASFIIKILFGIAYGFIFLKFYAGDDTWKHHKASIVEYQKLLHHPILFLQDTFTNTSGRVSLDAVYDTKNSFWNNIDEILFIKMLAIFNVFSFGNYYVNVVLFCFIVYLANLLLFRLLVRYFPKASFWLLIAIFYIPVIVFWLSGIRKDGLLFVALAMVLFYFDSMMRKEGGFLKNAFLFLFGFLVLYLIRNLMVMCVAPALFGWFLCRLFRINALLTFIAVYALTIFLFFASGNIHGLPDLAQKVVDRQYDFFSLTANTRLALDSLQATSGSYLNILPQALNHSFLRPYLTESKGILQVISALDVVFFIGVLILAVFFHIKKIKIILQNPLILTCLFTSFFGYLLIGYTVPFPGAIVRYKIIFELLFLCAFAVLAEKRSDNCLTLS